MSVAKFDSKNNELVIIGTYPNTEDRVNLTKECIRRYKYSDRKILLVSHYPVDEETQKLVDFYFFDKENTLISHSYYSVFYNYTDAYDVNINLNGLKKSNQSLAVLTNLFNGFKMAKQLGFEKVFYTTYDVLLDPIDIEVVEDGFSKLDKFNAYLSNIPNPLGKGVETTAMWFKVDYFLDAFDDVRTEDEYNRACRIVISQNFLEHYMFKKLEYDSNIPLIETPNHTLLVNTGRGVQSYSEYFSILPIVDQENKYMVYFYTYNIDNRKLQFRIGDEIELIKIKQKHEYKKEVTYLGNPIKIELTFFDISDKIIKIDEYTLDDNLKDTGYFKWKTQ